MKKFNITNYQIELKDKKYKPFQRIRMILLSDLHNQIYGRDNAILLKKIDSLKPDLIGVAGDMINSDEKRMEKAALNLLAALAKKYPVYYANGNHEYRMKLDTETFGVRYERYAKALRTCGVVLLENEYVDVNVKGMPLRIYGYQLSWKYYRRFSREVLRVDEIRKELGTGTKERFQILLAHNPVFFSAYSEWGADLTLSGHLHGGFFRLPFIGGIISPQFELFPQYAKGIFERKEKHMIVSAGIGSHSSLPRIGNPPEVVAVDLY